MGHREESHEYWQQVEQELGERILGYALGQLHTPLESIPPFSYCLFYLTGTRLFIRYIPPEQKILSLPVGGASRNRQVQTISFPRNGIQKALVQIPNRGLWNWFFPPLATVRISFLGAEGLGSEIQFTMESRKNEFLQNLGPQDVP